MPYRWPDENPGAIEWFEWKCADCGQFGNGDRGKLALHCYRGDDCPLMIELKQEIWKRKTAMNYSTAVFLINPDARAIQCQYDPDDKSNAGKGYTFKTLDKSIKKDDLVVVPTATRHQLTVVKVIETDIDIDVDTPHEIKWVVGKVDLMTHQKLLDMEQEAIAKIKAAEMRKKRVELAATLKSNTDLDLALLPMGNASNIVNGEVVKNDGTPAE